MFYHELNLVSKVTTSNIYIPDSVVPACSLQWRRSGPQRRWLRLHAVRMRSLACWTSMRGRLVLWSFTRCNHREYYDNQCCKDRKGGCGHTFALKSQVCLSKIQEKANVVRMRDQERQKNLGRLTQSYIDLQLLNNDVIYIHEIKLRALHTPLLRTSCSAEQGYQLRNAY